MVVISYKRIKEFGQKHSNSIEALNTWFRIVEKSNWSNFHDMRKIFNSVDAVGNDLYIFNIRGNHIRIIARILFSVRTVFIKFIGNHKEYNEVMLDQL